MMAISKNDIIKTILILWFVLSTGYVIYDQYQGYKVRGMQAAYQTGYADSVGQLIAQTEKNGCTPIEVHRDDKKISVVNAECLSQSQQQSQNQQPTVQKGK